MKKHILPAIAALLAFVVLLNGCVDKGAEKTIRIGVLRIDDSIPLYIAEKEGLFEKYGMTVELVEFGSASDQSKAMEAGELDGLMTDMIVQSLIKKGGTDLRAVAMALGATEKEGRFMVVSSHDSGIVKPQDLAGASVAISENTMMDFLFEQYESILDLDKSSISKVHMPSLSLRVDAVLEGKDIKAAILPDPLASYAVQEGANIVIDDTLLGTNLSQSVIAVSEALISNRRTDVEKMLAAYNKAIKQINDNPDNYREECLKIANVPASLADGYPTPTYTPNCVPSRECVLRITAWMKARGLVKEEYSYGEIVDDSFIR